MNIIAEHKGIIVTTTGQERILCEKINLIGNFIILEEAKIRRMCDPSIRVELCINGNYQVSPVSFFMATAQIMLQQTDITRSTAILSKDDCDNWMMKTIDDAQNEVNKDQEKRNKENLEANSEYILRRIKENISGTFDHDWNKWKKDLTFFQKRKIKDMNKLYGEKRSESMSNRNESIIKTTLNDFARSYTEYGYDEKYLENILSEYYEK